MTLTIEIREQPERNRFWAEVEVGGMVARRKLVVSPQEDGLAGIIAEVYAAVAEMDPRFTQAQQENARERLRKMLLVLNSEAAPEQIDPVRSRPSIEILSAEEAAKVRASAQTVFSRSDSAALDALRAEAEAAGVRVDRRWGEARLREEIAAVGQGEAADAEQE